MLAMPTDVWVRSFSVTRWRGACRAGVSSSEANSRSSLPGSGDAQQRVNSGTLDRRKRQKRPNDVLVSDARDRADGPAEIPLKLRCECGRSGCDQAVRVDAGTYDLSREEPGRFLEPVVGPHTELEYAVDQKFEDYEPAKLVVGTAVEAWEGPARRGHTGSRAGRGSAWRTTLTPASWTARSRAWRPPRRSARCFSACSRRCGPKTPRRCPRCSCCLPWCLSWDLSGTPFMRPLTSAAGASSWRRPLGDDPRHSGSEHVLDLSRFIARAARARPRRAPRPLRQTRRPTAARRARSRPSPRRQAV
jgi:hypothetical protein